MDALNEQPAVTRAASTLRHPEPDELGRLLQPLYPGDRLDEAERLPGHGNLSFRVCVSGHHSPMVIRFHRRGALAARTQWDVMELVKGRVPVPLPLWSGTDPEWGAFTILRWVEGITLEALLRTGSPGEIRQAAAATGAALARIGSFPFRRPGFLGPGPNVVEPFDALSRTVRAPIERALFRGHAAARLGKELTLRVWNYTMRHSRSLDTLRDPACLVHGDFRPDNILVQRLADGWAVTGVLDWEWAFSGSPLYDAGALLRHTAENHPDFEGPFLAAFAQRGGELPANGPDLARLFDLVNLLDIADRAPDGDPDLAAAVRDIERAAGGETPGDG